MAHARWNRTLGWSLLIAGFLCAAWLDPLSLGTRESAAAVRSPQIAARQAQAVMLGIALLQLLVARMLAGATSTTGRASAGITAAGALIYALGYALSVSSPSSAWLIPAGALLNLLGFALLAWQARAIAPQAPGIRVLLPVICFGMALDTMAGLFAWSPERFLPAYLGPADGVRLRMLRLARAAAIALPILTLLYADLAGRFEARSRAVGWGRIALVAGAVGMPAILAAAALTSVHLKYLLALPADAVVAGTLIGTCLAWRVARPLEAWGWLLILLSMAAGLLMGTYAFDGPLPSPAFLGSYGDFPRRLTRLAHAYAIVLGLLCIFVARELEERPDPARRDGFRRLGIPLLVAGSVTTVLVIPLVGALRVPAGSLGLGPALVAAGTLLCIGPGHLRS